MLRFFLFTKHVHFIYKKFYVSDYFTVIQYIKAYIMAYFEFYTDPEINWPARESEKKI